MNFITTITSTQEIWRDSTQVFHTILGTNTVPLLEVTLGTRPKFNQTPRFDIGDPVKSKNQNEKIKISKKTKIESNDTKFTTLNSLHVYSQFKYIMCRWSLNKG